MAITNYLASTKTKTNFCGVDCCGGHFGRVHHNGSLRPQSSSPKRKMRRYARHADKTLLRREVESQLAAEREYFEAELNEVNLILEDSPYEDYLADYDHLDDYDCDYRDERDYDEPLNYYRRSYNWMGDREDEAINKIHRVMRESFQNGEISREKYHRLTDVLFSRD